jgi:hypothetical protein
MPHGPGAARSQHWTSRPPMWSPGSSSAQRKSEVRVPPADRGSAEPMQPSRSEDGLLPWSGDEAILSRTRRTAWAAVAALPGGLVQLQAVVTAIRCDSDKNHNQGVTRITDNQPEQVKNQNGARLVTNGPRAGGPVRGAAPCSLPTGYATAKTQTPRSIRGPRLSRSKPDQPSISPRPRRHAGQARCTTGRGCGVSLSGLR